MSEDNRLEEVHDRGVDLKDRVIYVGSEYEYEGEEVGTEHRMAMKFIKNLDVLNSINKKKITIKMMNIGGSWAYGMSMYDAIKKSPSVVEMILTGVGASMGSIIPQACKTRYITPYAEFMIHYGYHADDGHIHKVVNTLNYYKKTEQWMMDIYTERCLESPFAEEKDMNEKKVRSFLTRKLEKEIDWWLTPEEAVYYGFMDAIYE